jgi:hypothetical protein
MRWKMYSCKEIVEVVNFESPKNLSWSEKIHYKMHLMICTVCHVYAHKIELLGIGLKKLVLIKGEKTLEKQKELKEELIQNVRERHI